jgi:transcriptional regulator with XRE-family HTH domain
MVQLKEKKEGSKKPKNTRYDAVKRTQFGAIIKDLREAAGLTQNEFAKLVGQEYFTMISQVETGRVRVPPTDTELWARVLGVDSQAFAKECVRHYEVDEYFKAIYGKDTHPLI